MLIGLFGGTFDPPHLGHLALCQAAQAGLGLDRLFWLLTPNPPHKRRRAITPLVHRLAMVEIALTGQPFELSRLDIDRPAPHYAVDTVRLLAELIPSSKIIYLMGSDSLNDLPRWHRPRNLVASLHSIGVMRRPDEKPDLLALERVLPGLTAKVHFVEAPLVAISSSDIRRRVRSGKSIDQLVTPAIAEYIHDHRLYQSPVDKS